jgi:porphobilinogen synthase
MVRETRVSTSGLIYPMFVCPGTNVRNEVSSMPGVAQQSVDKFLEECREVEQLGIPAIILFGLPSKKDAVGSEASAADGGAQSEIEFAGDDGRLFVRVHGSRTLRGRKE